MSWSTVLVCILFFTPCPSYGSSYDNEETQEADVVPSPPVSDYQSDQPSKGKGIASGKTNLDHGRIFDLWNDSFGDTYGITVGTNALTGGAFASLGVLALGAVAVMFLGGVIGIPFIPFLSGGDSYGSDQYYKYEDDGYNSNGNGYTSNGNGYASYDENRISPVLSPILSAIDSAHEKYQNLKYRY